MPLANPPRLVPRRGVTSPVRYSSRLLSGSCWAPLWDPCYSWGGSWDPCWPSGLTWSLGCTFGSFGWGWTSYYPWSCYRSYRYYSSYSSGWWTPYYDPLAPSVYYPSTVYVYADSGPGAVVDEEPVTPGEQDEQVTVSRRPLSPVEQAMQYVDLGDFYFREGRYSEAANAYGRARALVPEDATVHFVLADAVLAGGDYHFAAFLIGEALRLDPELARADTDKRLLYGDIKDFERQMQTLKRYVAEKPYDAMAFLALGYNLKFSDKSEKALEAFKQVLKIDPSSQAARLFVDALTRPRPKVEAGTSDK